MAVAGDRAKTGKEIMNRTPFAPCLLAVLMVAVLTAWGFFGTAIAQTYLAPEMIVVPITGPPIKVTWRADTSALVLTVDQANNLLVALAEQINQHAAAQAARCIGPGPCPPKGTK